MLTRFEAICILFLAFICQITCESEPIAPANLVKDSCSKQQSFSTILLVGLFSSLVFCFIGILPAFFIRTDEDEKKFSKSSSSSHL